VAAWERPPCLTSACHIPGLLAYNCWNTPEVAGSLGDVPWRVVVAALDALWASILEVDHLLPYGGLVDDLPLLVSELDDRLPYGVVVHPHSDDLEMAAVGADNCQRDRHVLDDLPMFAILLAIVTRC